MGFGGLRCAGPPYENLPDAPLTWKTNSPVANAAIEIFSGPLQSWRLCRKINANHTWLLVNKGLGGASLPFLPSILHATHASQNRLRCSCMAANWGPASREGSGQMV